MGTYWKNITFVATISTTDFWRSDLANLYQCASHRGRPVEFSRPAALLLGGPTVGAGESDLECPNQSYQTIPKARLSKMIQAFLSGWCNGGYFHIFCKINQYDFISWCYVDVGTFCDVDQVFDVMLLLIVSLRLPELFGDFSGYFSKKHQLLFDHWFGTGVLVV